MQIVNGVLHLILNYDPLLGLLVAMSFIDLVELSHDSMYAVIR